MKSAALVFISICLAAALAVPDWTLVKDQEVTGDMKLSFKVALKPQNLEHMDQLFWQISDPESPLFGKFLTNAQIADLISLPENEIAQVEEYLNADAGKFCDVNVSRSIHRDYLHVETCVDQAQVIFPNLNLAIYQKVGGEKKILRSAILMDIASNLTLLGVPQELHASIEAIHDITEIPVHKDHFSQEASTSLPSPTQPWLKSVKELTITEIISSFGVTMDGITDEALQADSPQVRQSVIEFDEGSFSATGLASFQQKYGIRTDPITKVVGHEETEESNIEADLDVQTITAIAQGAQTWSFVFDATANFVDVVETVMSTDGSPQVISCCWSSVESVLGKSQVDASNTSFMKLGLAGYTWFNDAGDAGPTLNPDACTTFDAKFPSSSQYVVTVGGTKIDKNTNEEGAWFRSSGGFSNYLPRPSVQDSVVSEYLTTATLPPNPNGTRYTTTGRAFPDVSAFAAFYPMVYQGTFQAIGSGTSAATPQFAGIITLIQIQRYQKGLGPLGPLIQPIYKLSEGVGFDVVLGQTYALSRSGCTGDILPGFYATKGWDPATGLGSPKYDVLVSQLLNLGESSSS